MCRLGMEIINTMPQHCNQARIIGDIGGRAVREEGKAQIIDSQMSFNTVRELLENSVLSRWGLAVPNPYSHLVVWVGYLNADPSVTL